MTNKLGPYELNCADVLEWAERYDGEKFHALLCDPPYGLTNESRQRVCNRIANALIDVSLPNLDKGYLKILEQSDFSGIPLDGTPLSKRKIAMAIEASVSMPECTINLNGNVEIRKPKINTSCESATDVTNEILVNKLDTENIQFLGDYILDTRDAADYAIRNILSSDFAEFTAGSFSVPIIPVFMEKGGEPLATFLQCFIPSFGVFIGLRNDARCESKASPPILTRGRTINTLMLRFDVGGNAIKLFATHRTIKGDRLASLGSPKLIRADTTTSSLLSEFEPIRVGVVLPIADGTNTAYFHLWLPRDFWDKLKHILPQGGFMGKSWDSALPDVEMWRQLGRHLHPGAFGMAFSSARTYHQLARDLEDAGYKLYPSIFGWGYGSGFPKATNIGKQIDKKAGAERKGTGEFHKRNVKPYDDESGWNANNTVGDFEYTAPATPLAQTWEGHRYGLQALKPALEPIIVFQKPYEGKPIDSITKTGAGAMWIEGSRIGVEGGETHKGGFRGNHGIYGTSEEVETNLAPKGRWPANLVLGHHPECGERCHEDCVMGKFPVTKPSRVNKGKRSGKKAGCLGAFTGQENVIMGHNDAGGSASRFFYNYDWAAEVQERLENADAVRYCPKASRKERDADLSQLPMKTRNRVNPGGLEHDPKWAPVQARNCHPTVKPIALCHWLATLLLPPSEYAPRRLLTPFSGSSSEMIGAIQAGWDYVLGIEMMQEYCDIGEARLRYWSRQAQQIPIDMLAVKEKSSKGKE